MNKDLAYLVSNIDLQNKFKTTPDQIMIKLYPELNDIQDIMELLPSEVCVCFILLKTSEQSGHWTCLCRNNNAIYYFDSYGVAPDGELSRISPGVRYELNESQRSLTRLLKTIPHGYTFSYNSKQLQQYVSGVNTCGKWCAVFAKCVFEGQTLQEFQDYMTSMKKKYNMPFDGLVCKLYKTL
jgi:hypothetical protein